MDSDDIEIDDEVDVENDGTRTTLGALGSNLVDVAVTDPPFPASTHESSPNE